MRMRWFSTMTRHRSPPGQKKEKAETSKTIIMNCSLERSVHILHLHLFYLHPTKLYWCAPGLSFIGIFVRGQPQKKLGKKVKQDPTKHLRSNTSLYGYWFWVFCIQGKKGEMKSRLTLDERCQWSLSLYDWWNIRQVAWIREVTFATSRNFTVQGCVSSEN